MILHSVWLINSTASSNAISHLEANYFLACLIYILFFPDMMWISLQEYMNYPMDRKKQHSTKVVRIGVGWLQILWPVVYAARVAIPHFHGAESVKLYITTRNAKSMKMRSPCMPERPRFHRYPNTFNFHRKTPNIPLYRFITG